MARDTWTPLQNTLPFRSAVTWMYNSFAWCVLKSLFFRHYYFVDRCWETALGKLNHGTRGEVITWLKKKGNLKQVNKQTKTTKVLVLLGIIEKCVERTKGNRSLSPNNPTVYLLNRKNVIFCIGRTIKAFCFLNLFYLIWIK